MSMLEISECHLGYPREQVVRVVSAERIEEFDRWMIGQTMAICEGRSYNYDKKEYEPTGCGPHGSVVYPWDVQRFLDGRPIID